MQLVHKAAMDKEWFRARKKELGLTNEDVAAFIGRDQSIVSKNINGKVSVEVEHIPGYAKALQVSRSVVLEKFGISDGAGPSNEQVAGNAAVVRLEGASLERVREDLPVHGSALGAAKEVDGEAIEQTNLNSSEVLEYVKRPVLLNRRPDAYALYVQGSSMHPALPDGDMLAVAPNMPLSAGDNVVVYLRVNDPDIDDGARARAVLVKELVRRTASYVELRQYQPAKDFRIPMSDVLRIDRVLTRREMLD